MEKTIIRKIKMYDKVDFVLQKDESIWITNSGFKENVNLFRAYREKVAAQISLQSKSTSSSAGKKMAEDKMTDLTLLVCNLAMVHASQQKSKELKVEFDYSISDLKKGIEDEILNRCEKICKNALPIADKLTALGMPVDQLDKLNLAIKEFKKFITLPESIINASKSAKEEMFKHIAECDEMLKNRLDKMMLLFKETQSEFYTEYFNARYIGGWSRKENGEVVGSEEPIKK